MSDTLQSNRLPVLAAQICEAHAGVRAAATTAAERAIEAGHALLEAKALVAHGQWLPWLKQYCRLPERTAQFYMKIAKLGLKPATVADIGLKAAAAAIVIEFDYWCGLDDEAKRPWHIFALFLVSAEGWPAEGAESHAFWIIRQGFASPDDWFGAEADEYRKRVGCRPISVALKTRWASFASLHRDKPIEELAQLFGDAA
jgi:hypothetical protein